MGVSPARDAVLTAYAKSLIRFKARQICRKTGFIRSDEDDLIQELTLRLLEKADRYDAGRGASIDTFADRVVCSAVKMILRDRRRHKRAAGFTARSIDSTTAHRDGEEVPLRECLGDADRQRVTLRDRGAASADGIDEALSLLPSELRAVAQQLMSDNVASVARGMGVSRRHVYAAISRIRQHFQHAGLGTDASDGQVVAPRHRSRRDAQPGGPERTV